MWELQNLHPTELLNKGRHTFYKQKQTLILLYPTTCKGVSVHPSVHPSTTQGDPYLINCSSHTTEWYGMKLVQNLDYIFSLCNSHFRIWAKSILGVSQSKTWTFVILRSPGQSLLPSLAVRPSSLSSLSIVVLNNYTKPFSSETTWLIRTNLGINVSWGILHRTDMWIFDSSKKHGRHY